ncbi:hypothetical protein OG225_13640 [Nocardia sp. NBC_01377]|uniref:hypothetical protein n=1 Tax=Nocardia sp. NBC_01377 TaxID=2903595 RepID=UPI0032446DAB
MVREVGSSGQLRTVRPLRGLLWGAGQPLIFGRAVREVLLSRSGNSPVRAVITAALSIPLS